MTDIELLPLPKKAQLVNPYAGRGIPTYGHSDETLTDYARAVAEHNVAARDAEIEALRAEVERQKQWLSFWRSFASRQATLAEQDEARAERLAEALRELVALGHPRDPAIIAAKKALRDHNSVEST